MNSMEHTARSPLAASKRLFLVSGILCVALGAGWMFPIMIGCLTGSALPRDGYAAVTVGVVLTVSGVAVVLGSVVWRGREMPLIPAPVRAVMAGNIVFLAFCALETSDGLVYRGGRIVYWTSFLFLPALALLYGHALAHRWAWWVAKIMAVLAALWFLGFIVLLPFAHLQGPSGPTPWYGRLYMAGVSLIFAGIAAYVLRSLNQPAACHYFRLVPER
jgi:hypothetical protein